MTDGRTEVQTDRWTDEVIAVTLHLHFEARINESDSGLAEPVRPVGHAKIGPLFQPLVG